MTPTALLVILALFAAVCLWQLLAGLKKMRLARANPGDPNAQLLGKAGKLQAILGGVMLAANILFNLPMLKAVL